MKKTLKLLFLLATVIGMVAIVLFGKTYFQHVMKENVIKSETLYILRNSNTEDLYDSIVKKQLIKDTNGFYGFLIKKNYRNKNIVAGKYKVKAGWSNNELVNHLRAGNGRIESKVVITPTRDLSSLSAKIAKDIRLDSSTINQYLNNSKNWERYNFNQENRLCLFIPNTYFVDWDITNEEFLKRMKLEYDKFWDKKRRQMAKNIGLTPNEVQTLASIVYWETKKDKDMPTVAGVYMNRIKLGIPLQADPTLIFAHNDYKIKRVLNVHKNIESPYNTYKNKGLPPGPILIAPIKYVDAVLYYEKHDYLFFVAKEDFSGYSYFSKTNAEHEKYANKYRKALDERNVKK